MSRPRIGTSAERRLPRTRLHDPSVINVRYIRYKGWQVVIRLLGLLIAMVYSLGVAPSALQAWALSTFDPPRQFVATKACKATASLQPSSASTAVKAGQTFKAFGTNKKKPDATHVQIEVKGKRRWVEMTCGEVRFATASQKKVPVKATKKERSKAAVPPPSKSKFQPFFDNRNHPEKVRSGRLVDMTPPAPQLSAFDRAVNQLCGAIGTRVSPRAFQAMMRAHPKVLKAVQTFTKGKVFGQERSLSSLDVYLDKLTEAWFSSHGFEHIYCGEPTGVRSVGCTFGGAISSCNKSNSAAGCRTMPLARKRCRARFIR